MKSKSSIYIIMAMTAIFIANHAPGQDMDSLPMPDRKNIIKYNLTSPLLFGWGNVIVGYERVVNPKQSFSIAVGYRVLPQLKNPDSSFLIRDYKSDGGFSINLDYRFYLLGRNKFIIPDGLYVAPFADYFTAGFTNDFLVYESGILKTNVSIATDVNMVTVGAKIGYQLVFKDRFVIDMTFLGPAYGWYNAKLQLDGELSVDEENEYYQEIKELILKKYPFLEGFPETKIASARGTYHTLAVGFHYSIKIGYKF